MRVVVWTTGALGLSSDQPIRVEVHGEPGEAPIVHIHGDTAVEDVAGTEGTRVRSVGVPMIGMPVRRIDE